MEVSEQQPEAPEKEFTDQTCTISVWAGSWSDFTNKRLNELRIAGVNTIIGVNPEYVDQKDMQQLLDNAAHYGMKIIPDLRGWDGETVPDYANHPAVAGFLMFDEPSASDFDNLSVLKTKFDALMPEDKQFYVNLHPQSSSRFQLGTTDYADGYVGAFVDAIDPDELAVDIYPISTKGIKKIYFENLAILAAKAREKGIPFQLTILSAGHRSGSDTFVTQPDGEENEGCDGAIQPIAFAANQRDEVRDLHDVAGALGAQPGMKQQTFIAAGFSAGQGSKAGGVGYQEECAPTLKASDSGTNMVPSVLCLNDQGGSVMECSEDVSGTLRAQEHGHQPLVYENHGIDARYTGPHSVAPTMSARYGTGGNNVPLVEQDTSVYCIVGNAIDRQPQNGGNGIGYQRDIAYTLTATDHHAVFSRQRVDVFTENEVVSTESARQHKDATDLVAQPYQDAVGALVRSDHKGISNQYVGDDKCIVESHNLIRRLTPLECERLQGLPDGWTNIPGASDSARYKALGNSVAIPCVEYVMRGIAIVLRAERRRRVWLVIVIQQIEIRSTGI